MLMHLTCKHGSFAGISKEPSEMVLQMSSGDVTSALAKVPDGTVKFMRWHRAAEEYKRKQVMKTKEETI